MIIGAAWEKTDKNGKMYLSVKLEGLPLSILRGDGSLAMFRNEEKENENQPDWRVVQTDRKEEKPDGPRNA